VPGRVEDRFRRLLLLIPFVLERPDVTVQEVCEVFGITRGQLVADLDLLFVCGVPPYGPGELIEAEVVGGTVHIRAADYFSRPPRLSSEEGLLLLAGARALVTAGVTTDTLQSALRKLEMALGPDLAGRVSIGLAESAALEEVRRALEERKRLHLVYYSQWRETVTEREIDPWALFGAAGQWYVVGWCHLARGERLFRVDRMKEASVLDKPAEIPEDLDLDRYETLYVEGPGAIEVTLDLAPAASWLAEDYPLKSRESLEDGWTRITLSTGNTTWLERLLLRLGDQARIVAPPELATDARRRACRLASLYR
jgi:proteasome accessory factor C